MELKFRSQNVSFLAQTVTIHDKKEHPVFRREGNELTTKMKISLSEVTNLVLQFKILCLLKYYISIYKMNNVMR